MKYQKSNLASTTLKDVLKIFIINNEKAISILLIFE